MLTWAREHLRRASADSASLLVAIQKDPCRPDDPLTLRRLLLDFITDFSNWDNSTVREYLETRLSSLMFGVAVYSLVGPFASLFCNPS